MAPEFDLDSVMILRLEVGPGEAYEPHPELKLNRHKLDARAHAPESMSWEAFVQRFCPNLGDAQYRGEILNVNHLQIGDLVGLTRHEDGSTGNFIGGYEKIDGAIYVVLPQHIVDRWREVYLVHYISPVRDRIPLPALHNAEQDYS